MGERDLMPFGADSSLVVMGEGLCYYQVERCAEVLTHSFGERPIVKLCFPNQFHFLSFTAFLFFPKPCLALSCPAFLTTYLTCDTIPSIC